MGVINDVIAGKLGSLLDALAPFLPPAIGAYIGLRYAKQQSKRDHAISWVCAAAAGIYVGAALGEHFGFGLKVTGGLMFVIAMFSSELFAVVIAALRQWAADPVETFKRWRDAWLGRGSQ